MTSRINKRWTVNELLALEREHDLLEMDIFDIALKHKRTPKAILYKLEDEKIISNWSEARGYDKYSNLEQDSSCTSNFNAKLAKSLYQSNALDLMENQSVVNRVSYLENIVTGIQNTLATLTSKLLPRQSTFQKC
jgi:hypothetical protein